MPQITNVRIMRFRKVQPEQFGGAGAEVELHATVHEGEDYRDVARNLLFEARAFVYENLNMRLPKEASVALSDSTTTAEVEEKTEEEKPKRGRGRPKGSGDTRPRKSSKAAKVEADEIPGDEDEKPKPQISTNPEDRKDPADEIPGSEESGDPVDDIPEDSGDKVVEAAMTPVELNEYINSSIRGGKLTGLQAKEMMKTMKIARVRDLDTPEKIAEAKLMIDTFIESNGS